MEDTTGVALVQRWQEAANQRDIPLLLALSDTGIELVGPRGAAYGHSALASWVQRAWAQFTLLRVFARGGRVVVAQRGAWRSPETGEVIGEAEVATSFLVQERVVARVARYDTLEQALEDARLAATDEQAPGVASGGEQGD